MAYRRYPTLGRRYVNANPAPAPAFNMGAAAIPEEIVLKEENNIPLPNEFESDPGLKRNQSLSFLPNIFNRIFGRIELDDIILIGLIFILLQEKIEDEFLLILLIYILLA